MKITGYRTESYRADRGRRTGDANNPEGQPGESSGSLLFLETDVGITGIVPGGISDALFCVVEGEDPRGVAGLWKKVNDHVFKVGDYRSIASLDIAMWDIKAKANDEPLWRTFGASEGRVKAYASGLDMPLSDDELAAFYTSLADLGVDGGKLKVGLDQKADLRRLAIMRDCLAKVKDDPYLMIDANEYWSPKQAIGKVSEMEEHFDLFWVEEPARRWDYNGLKQVSRGIKAAVASGENLHHIGDYMPLIGNDAIDVVQFGSGGCAGFTGAIYLAGMAHGFEKPVSVIGGVGHFAAHVAASFPNHNMMEVKDLHTPPAWSTSTRIEDGWIVLGDEAGLGITVHEEELGVESSGQSAPSSPAGRRAGAGLYENPPEKPIGS
jgi:L-alanine-DL-glutamate epimerase-like enolase superfamily enzyme